jgi:anti-sigma regulatory factor (Ser/Thr protein kinase)
MHYCEWLLNLAFAQASCCWLLCPYGTAHRVAQEVAAVARCHPLAWDGSTLAAVPDYVRGPYAFDALSEPAEPAQELPYTVARLAETRDAAGSRAATLGLPQERVSDLVLAVSEVASNSIRHGGGRGLLRMWVEDGAVVCELSDAGYIADPLAGKLRPTARRIGGTGLWFAHQLCDLVQIRSTRKDGTRVRLHAKLSGAPHA